MLPALVLSPKTTSCLLCPLPRGADSPGYNSPQHASTEVGNVTSIRSGSGSSLENSIFPSSATN